MSHTAAIILAAGASTRMLEPKQLVLLGQEKLLERSVRVVTEAGCFPIKLVLGCAADLIRRSCNVRGADIVLHADWSEGMASSIGAGVRSLPNVDGAILMTCDMPAVTVEHLQELMATGEVTASRYAGRYGVPAYFPRESFAPLLVLKGDSGAKEILRSARSVELLHGALDVDTPQDLERAREIFV